MLFEIDRRSAVELIGEEAVATLELLGVVADDVREVHGLLVDDQLLEVERHDAFSLPCGAALGATRGRKQKGVSRPQESRRRFFSSPYYFLCSPALIFAAGRQKSGRQDLNLRPSRERD